MQYKAENSAKAIEWLGDDGIVVRGRLHVETPDGTAIASDGDYLVAFPGNHVRVIRKDEFEARYRIVEAN